ncbi:MAG: hypothetical protein GWP91_16410, partial [Rhodobacterales bacterium]|nr:hypothetical protein [Rhodobacterales bacterium]
GAAGDVGVFRAVVALERLSAGQPRAPTVGRTDRAGYKLDFSGLVRSSPFGGDAAVEEERSIHMFFRLLTDASDGSTRVALSLWARCLVPTDDPKVLQVRIDPSLAASGVLDLGDTALFALVALRIQDELNETELQAVTNLSPHLLRATIRDLMSRGMVVIEGGRLRIPDLQLPVVTRTLRRRHFLHVGG